RLNCGPRFRRHPGAANAVFASGRDPDRLQTNHWALPLRVKATPEGGPVGPPIPPWRGGGNGKVLGRLMGHATHSGRSLSGGTTPLDAHPLERCSCSATRTKIPCRDIFIAPS